MILSNAEAILEHAKAANIQFLVKNDKLIVEAPPGAMTDDFKQCLLKNKETLMFILTHHGISQNELKTFLAEDWNDYQDNPESLIAWSDLLANRRLIEQGTLPPNFTAITHCNGCGNVFVPPEVTTGGTVFGCPWCRNRVDGLPIPKPSPDLIRLRGDIK